MGTFIIMLFVNTVSGYTMQIEMGPTDELTMEKYIARGFYGGGGGQHMCAVENSLLFLLHRTVPVMAI